MILEDIEMTKYVPALQTDLNIASDFPYFRPNLSFFHFCPHLDPWSSFM